MYVLHNAWMVFAFPATVTFTFSFTLAEEKRREDAEAEFEKCYSDLHQNIKGKQKPPTTANYNQIPKFFFKVA